MAEAGIPKATLSKFRANFEAEPRFRLAQNVCTKFNPLHVLRKRSAEEELSHVFTHKVETEGKPVTNQKNSGRCWLFSCLNCMRQPFMKACNIEEFEFSQAYLFFWDKVERFNFLMNAYIDASKQGEVPDGRLFQHLTADPSEDGGQWSMIVNLVEKHGVMPKKCFPDASSCLQSKSMGSITNTKMREYCMKLHDMVKAGKSEEELSKAVEGFNEEIFRIVSICLGTPAETFTWEYYDKNKEYHKVGPITPLDFYKQHVKPVFNMEDKVVLVNDPRPENPYNHLYTVKYLGNMVGSKPVLYINLQSSLLKEFAKESIKNKEAVWIGSDEQKFLSWEKLGLEDVTAFDYGLVFGISMLNQTKAERLLYRESLMVHAMVLTAVSIQDDKTTKWRIENSWGDEAGDKGYLNMTDDWFTEFLYEVAVDKKYLPDDILDILKQQPKVLPAWDPMGALAK